MSDDDGWVDIGYLTDDGFDPVFDKPHNSRQYVMTFLDFMADPDGGPDAVGDMHAIEDYYGVRH